MIDPDAIYEEVEMNNESDAKDQNTDSENEIQEVIVGEDAIEQHLDEVVLYDNAFEGRPVRRRPPPPPAKKAFVQQTKPPVSPMQRVQRPGVLARQQSSLKYAPAQKTLPTAAKPTKPTQLVSHAVPLKRKMEAASPLIVKLEGIKRTRPGESPLPVRAPPAPQRPVRIVKHGEAQTEITGEIMDQYQQIIEEDQQKLSALEEQVRKLKYTPEMFENDDKRTQYFTGLETFVNMVTLFNLCEPDLPASPTVTKFEIFMLSLIRLRLKLPFTLIGYMLGLSPKAADFFFNEGIQVLHSVMREILIDNGEGKQRMGASCIEAE